MNHPDDRGQKRAEYFLSGSDFNGNQNDINDLRVVLCGLGDLCVPFRSILIKEIRLVDNVQIGKSGIDFLRDWETESTDSYPRKTPQWRVKPSLRALAFNSEQSPIKPKG